MRWWVIIPTRFVRAGAFASSFSHVIDANDHRSIVGLFHVRFRMGVFAFVLASLTRSTTEFSAHLRTTKQPNAIAAALAKLHTTLLWACAAIGKASQTGCFSSLANIAFPLPSPIAQILHHQTQSTRHRKLTMTARLGTHAKQWDCSSVVVQKRVHPREACKAREILCPCLFLYTYKIRYT